MTKTSAGTGRLRAWMETTESDYPQLAADLQISVPHLSRLVTGARRPSLPLAVRIAARTGIPVSAWTQPPVKAEAVA